MFEKSEAVHELPPGLFVQRNSFAPRLRNSFGRFETAEQNLALVYNCVGELSRRAEPGTELLQLEKQF